MWWVGGGGGDALFLLTLSLPLSPSLLGLSLHIRHLLHATRHFVVVCVVLSHYFVSTRYIAREHQLQPFFSVLKPLKPLRERERDR